MPIPDFEYVEAHSVSEACRLLAASSGAEALAGGTELLMAMRHRSRRPGRLVDLAGVPGLAELSPSADGGLAIGSSVTLARLAADPLVARRYPALAEAALSVGSPQLREMGTLAGNLCQDTCCTFLDRSPEQRSSLEPCHKLDGCLCHVVSTSESCWATYSGDLAPVLLVLGASIDVAAEGSEERRPLASLYSLEGVHPLTLRPGELVTRIHVPAPAGRAGAVYLKLRQRTSLDYPLVGIAAALELAEDGSCARAALALTGVDRGPVIVEEAARLVGEAPTEAALEVVARAAAKRVHPVKNLWGFSASYRLRMVGPWSGRALRQALTRAGAGESP